MNWLKRLELRYSWKLRWHLQRLHCWLQYELRAQWSIIRWRCYWCGNHATRYQPTPGGRVPACGNCAVYGG